MSNQPAPMSTTTSDKRDSVIQDMLDSLKKFVDGVLTLEVATYISFPEAESQVEFPVGDEKYKAVLQCYTKIKFDQDAIQVLPVQKVGDEVKLNEEIYNLHKQQVDTAIQTRTEMVKAVMDALAKLLPG